MYSSFLSPIDDYSNLPFRLLCQKYGADATCIPLVNSTTIARNPEKLGMVDANSDEQNIGVQLVGNVPEDIGKAANTIVERFPFLSWLNINCGCPSVRTMNSGGGSALLSEPEKIARAVEEIKKHTELPVSVKIRIKNNVFDTVAICKKLELAGTDFIIIHGRTAGQGYSGKADWELIKQVREEISLLIVGNGDLRSAEEGERYVKEGYCDSFMIARSAMGNPLVFQNSQPDIWGRITLFKEYIYLYRKYLGELDKRDLKLKGVNFVSGIPNAGAIRNAICRAETTEKIEEIIHEAGIEGEEPPLEPLRLDQSNR